MTASLKTDTSSLTFKLVSADSQSNKSTALFISQLLFLSSLEKNAIQFSHKQMAKKLLNRTLQKLVGGGSGGEKGMYSRIHYHIRLEVNNKSIQNLEFSKMFVGSLIICNKPTLKLEVEFESPLN